MRATDGMQLSGEGGGGGYRERAAVVEGMRVPIRCKSSLTTSADRGLKPNCCPTRRLLPT